MAIEDQERPDLGSNLGDIDPLSPQARYPGVYGLLPPLPDIEGTIDETGLATRDLRPHPAQPPHPEERYWPRIDEANTAILPPVGTLTPEPDLSSGPVRTLAQFRDGHDTPELEVEEKGKTGDRFYDDPDYIPKTPRPRGMIDHYDQLSPLAQFIFDLRQRDADVVPPANKVHLPKGFDGKRIRSLTRVMVERLYTTEMGRDAVSAKIEKHPVEALRWLLGDSYVFRQIVEICYKDKGREKAELFALGEAVFGKQQWQEVEAFLVDNSKYDFNQ